MNMSQLYRSIAALYLRQARKWRRLQSSAKRTRTHSQYTSCNASSSLNPPKFPDRVATACGIASDRDARAYNIMAASCGTRRTRWCATDRWRHTGLTPPTFRQGQRLPRPPRLRLRRATGCSRSSTPRVGHRD